MSASGEHTQTDNEFERSLLESAKADGPSHPTDEAWATLCASLAPLQLAPPQPSAAGPVPRPRPLLSHAAAWLTLGGLGGALATALWLGAFRPAPPPAAPPPEAPARLEIAPAEPASEPTPAPAPPPPAASAELPREPPPVRKPAPPPPKQAAAERSSLSAEVAALDRANTSLRGSQFEAALRAVEQYRRDFPRGVLARDAEMIAIDALDGLHDTAALQQRGREFLLRYPSDPHAPRVQSLMRVAR